jgi:altronate dehydratase large subunit
LNPSKLSFFGYPRPDGSVGVRNKVAVLYTVDCARFVSEEIARSTPEGASLGWFNCYSMRNNEDKDILIGLGKNPNVGAALVIGLGCETNSPSKVADGLSRTGKGVHVMAIQAKGTKKSIETGTKLVRQMARKLRNIKRKSFDISCLTVGLKCGGSDATSALSANPVLGLTADRIVDNGGRVLSSELTELAGCEHLIRERSINSRVGEQAASLITASVSEFEARFGLEHSMMSPGNVAGGLTTIEEKSLGALMKTGHRPLHGVLQPGEYPEKNEGGWYLVDGLVAKSIRHFGLEADGEPTDFAAAGAQIVMFTTGRGSANGNALVPTLKICANPQTYRRMKDDMDFNAGAVIEGKQTLDEAARGLFHQLITVASGKPTKSEVLGHREGGIILGGTPLGSQSLFCE